MSSFLEHVASDLLARFGTNLSRVAVVTRCTGIDETLDHFYGWGQLLLSDFDDLDKNMGPADRVFANLRDIHELDDVSYLTDEQRKLIQRFFSNFSDEHNSELKQRFLRLWSRIGDIYHTFNEQLAAQGLAYEGALYRQVVEDETITFDYDTYVFVGFNLLQHVEQTLFRRLEREGKALFYQDTEEQPPQQITFISAPTENIQARYVSQWLTPERIADGRRTAVVLCNEGLLQAVIHCLPDTVDKVNVTTGYPLLQTPIASLVTQLLNLQVNGFSTRTQSFRRRWLDTVARHPYAAFLPEDYAATHITDGPSLLHWLLSLVRHIATCSACGNTIATTPASASNSASDISHSCVPSVASDQRSSASFLTPPSSNDPLTSESLFRMYTLLNRLSGLTDEGILTVDIPTLQRLVAQVVQSTTIPFHGEPAEGIQVMGVLETRNLDFDHVLLLSCNEGNMPRGVNDTSFIPYAIRKAYGLTTVDYKVAIYEHYFHRLLQRAHDVTIVYNNATVDAQKGEMSRFMLQLMVDSSNISRTSAPPHPRTSEISFRSLRAGQSPLLHQPQPIDKTAAILDILRQRFSNDRGGISPTAVSTYLRCQLRFFYRYVSNLQEPDDIDDELIDNRLFGNIFHKAAQTLYEPFNRRRVTTMMLDDLLKDEVAIERAVDAAIRNELFKNNGATDSSLSLDGLQLINREVIIKYVHLLIETDRRLAPFTILGLEKRVSMPWGDTKVGGIIDRLDSVTDPATGQERIRVIDYKTGARHLRPMPDIDAIFDPAQISNHSDYYLQAFLYSHIVRQHRGEPVSPSLLFIQHAAAEGYDPTLVIGREPVTDIAVHSDRFIALLKETTDAIFSPDLRFTPTDDRNRCRSCPYTALCGR